MNQNFYYDYALQYALSILCAKFLFQARSPYRVRSEIYIPIICQEMYISESQNPLYFGRRP